MDAKYFLKISSLRLWISIGCKQEEKYYKQPIDVDIALYFHNQPTGCDTDKIEDTVCYSTLCRLITNDCEKRDFNLIESLSKHIYTLIKKHLDCDTTNIEVVTTKIRPPISQLQCGVSFTYRDF